MTELSYISRGYKQFNNHNHKRNKMKIICFIVFTILISAQSEAQSNTDKIINWTIGTYGVAAFVDVSTTQYGLGKGIVHEANPLQKYFTDKGPVVSGIAKGAMHTGIIYLLLKYKHEHKKEILLSTLTLTGLQILVDYKNMKMIKEK